MDKIKVELLGISGLEGAYRAVQKPYGKKVDNPSELFYKVAKILKHESILEHIIFQFDLIGSSRLELQEHMRHRMASPTVCSTRYSLNSMCEELKNLNSSYTSQVDGFLYKYTVFTKRMLEEKNNEIKSKEYLMRLDGRLNQLKTFCALKDRYGADEAKYELIESLRTSFVWTINARSMLNFLKLRTSKNAHFEIRHIANLMKDLLCENEEIKNLIGD